MLDSLPLAIVSVVVMAVTIADVCCLLFVV